MPTDGSGKGKVYERRHCYGSIHDQNFYDSAKNYEASAARRMKYWRELAKQQREADSDQKVRGKPPQSAANVVMRILCGARFVRMDLLRMIGFLACQFTRWTSTCDRRLFRLVCCCAATVKAVRVAWVGDPLGELQPCLHADADFAGCMLTQRSTTGV